jgi:hypothetical protein
MRFAICVLLLAGLAATGDDPWTPHRKLGVLYAGKEGGSREKVFAAFLKEHFDRSATIPLQKLSMETARDYDVVIVDWTSQYGNDGYPKKNELAPLTLGPEFTKPLIAMTYVGTCVRRGYKLDWL